MAREPGYCKHKPTGQAYVNLGGRVIYLGLHGTEESIQRYNRLKAEWLLNRHAGKFSPKAGPTVADVCLAYLDYAEVYYKVGSELAIRPLSQLYATLPAAEFRTVQFCAVREWWLSDNSRCRQYVNKQMKRLVRVIKWAVASGLMPTDNYTAIKCFDPLKKGRCTAAEAKPITCVDANWSKRPCPTLRRYWRIWCDSKN